MGLNRVNEEIADLDEFVGSTMLEEILGVVKSGKEATVYCARAGKRLGGGLVAAKVYRARSVRQFANAAAYNAGRLRQRQRRETRAIENRSRFGQETAFAKWVADEYETLRLLYDAGVCVPRPLASSDRIILMEYVGDEDEPGAPLTNVPLTPDEATALFETLMRNVERMLACDRVHGDLSAYNVLYHDGDVRIIDLPQAVDARFNPNALDLLDRDVDQLCRHFARFGVRADAWRLSRGMWARYLRSEL
ncbi:MAG: serine protein kinase RIO [Chloroflexi bacterium]|nr:serine protein kinase RIO [Chloroflexota bacterium]